MPKSSKTKLPRFNSSKKTKQRSSSSTPVPSNCGNRIATFLNSKRSSSFSSSSPHFTVPETEMEIEYLEKEDYDFFRDYPEYLHQFQCLDIEAITKKPSSSKSTPAGYPKKSTSEPSTSYLESKTQTAVNEEETEEDDEDEDVAFTKAVQSIQLNIDSEGEEEEEKDESNQEEDDEINQVLIEGDEEEEEEDDDENDNDNNIDYDNSSDLDASDEQENKSNQRISLNPHLTNETHTLKTTDKEKKNPKELSAIKKELKKSTLPILSSSSSASASSSSNASLVSKKRKRDVIANQEHEDKTKEELEDIENKEDQEGDSFSDEDLGDIDINMDVEDEDEDEDEDDDNDELEKGYTLSYQSKCSLPTTSSSNSDMTSLRLPIKTQTGKLIRASSFSSSSMDSISTSKLDETEMEQASLFEKNNIDLLDMDDDDDDDDDDEDLETTKTSHPPSSSLGQQKGKQCTTESSLDPSNTTSTPNQDVHPIQHIAFLSESILQDPELHVTFFAQLQTYMKEGHPLSPKTQSLALLSLCQLFLDLIPGYKIQLLNDFQLKEKVSKEVKKLRQYEHHFLHAYQRYLIQLDNFMTHASSSSSLKQLAMLSFCQLLQQHPHFNFRLNILNTLIHGLAKRAFRPTILTTLIKVFQDDEEGDISNEAVRLISKLVKKSNFKVHPEVLRCFEHLRLKEELTLDDILNPSKPTKKKDKQPLEKGPTKLPRTSRLTQRQRRELGPKASTQMYMNRNQMKQNKVLKQAEVALKLTQATVDLETRKRHHRVCLEHVFLTYFRALKQAPSSSLLLPVLDGLKLFAHLISLDFFHSLLNVLKTHFHSTWIQPTQQLQVLSTLYVLAKSHGEFLHLDLSSFYSSCYQLLPTLSPLTPSFPSTLYMFLQFLDVAFPSTQTHHSKLIFAFFVQLFHFCLLMDHPHTLLASLSLLHTWVQRFPMLFSLLDPYSERSIQGSYVYQTSQPSLSHATSASPWPFHLCLNHWHPEVRLVTQTLLRNWTQLASSSSSSSTSFYVPMKPWQEYFEQWDWKLGKHAMQCFQTPFLVSPVTKKIGSSSTTSSSAASLNPNLPLHKKLKKKH